MAETKALSNRTRIEFKVRTIDNQRIIIVVKEEVEQLPIIKFHPPEDYYAKGLEKNYKELVDMGSVANATAEILQMLYDTDNLTEEMYNNAVIKAIRPCRQSFRIFHILDEFIKMGEDNTWL